MVRIIKNTLYTVKRVAGLGLAVWFETGCGARSYPLPYGPNENCRVRAKNGGVLTAAVFAFEPYSVFDLDAI